MMKKKRARRASLAYRVNILIFVITFIVSLLMVVICDSDYRKAVLVPYTRKLAALEVHPEEFTPYTEHFMKFFGTEELQNAKASLDTENDYFIDWLDKQPSFTADDAEFGRRSLFLDWISADLALEEIMLSIDLDEACLEVQKNQTVYRISHETKETGHYTANDEFGLEKGFLDQPAEKYTSPILDKIGDEYKLLRCVQIPCEGGAGRLWMAYNMTEHALQHGSFLMRSILYMIVLAVGASTISVLLMKRYVTEPVRMLAQAATDFVPEEDGSYSPDKISKVAIPYENEIGDLSRETRIQESMLPSISPAYPDRTEFDLFASMTPAKEVGGDFYDFFLIDRDHLALVMADVSGKGVPGALFMMVSKAILKNNAMVGKSVGEILAMTNDLVCANNKMEMFVTVWFGILEISTGKIIAANAGHEYPALTQNGVYTLLKDKHSFIIGGMEGTRYAEYEIRLKPGDRLFLYTDGVPEAVDAKNNMFGTDRMLGALNAEPDASLERTLENVRNAVDGFVSGAERFDDMTMLCLEYKGPKN